MAQRLRWSTGQCSCRRGPLDSASWSPHHRDCPEAAEPPRSHNWRCCQEGTLLCCRLFSSCRCLGDPSFSFRIVYSSAQTRKDLQDQEDSQCRRGAPRCRAHCLNYPRPRGQRDHPFRNKTSFSIYLPCICRHLLSFQHTPLLFVTRFGIPITKRSLRVKFAAFGVSLGAPNLCPHSARHLFITHHHRRLLREEISEKAFALLASYMLTSLESILRVGERMIGCLLCCGSPVIFLSFFLSFFLSLSVLCQDQPKRERTACGRDV